MVQKRSQDKRIIVVTATYSRPGQIHYLRRMGKTLKAINNLFWIISEEAKQPNDRIVALLLGSSIQHKYLNIDPVGDMGNAPKNAGLAYIKKNNLEGIVYIADDDNFYQKELFEEIRKTIRVAIMPVGNIPGKGTERPVVVNSRIVSWEANWQTRKYPVDWAAVSFNSDVLKNLDYPFIGEIMDGAEPVNFLEKSIPERKTWLAAHCGGESEFLEKIVDSKDELEVGLCDECTRCYVWYNEPVFFREKIRKQLSNKSFLYRIYRPVSIFAKKVIGWFK
ncbi:MAG: hypothetical protein HQL30_05520 [Candidatus Omnitrophica bacterium]|nr:hypothetical protein [Candidatus Omnitrophota bacterium]